MEPPGLKVARGDVAEEADGTTVLRDCRVCARPVDFSLTAREMTIGLRESFDYYECRRCGCLQIGTIPGDLDRYYTSSYYTKSQRDHVSRRGRFHGLRTRLTLLRLQEGFVARAVSGRRYAGYEWFRRTRTGIHDEILDVGCGSGRLLHRLDAAGFERLTGIDPRRKEGPFESVGPRFERVSLEAHRGRYHLVMAHHSFEHAADPVRGFEAFGRLVEPGGYLLLRLPVADCWARRVYGADWVQLDAPRHLHVHTRRSIALLADRSGFRITHIADDSGPFQIWGSELYRRDIPLSQAGHQSRRAIESLRFRYRAHELSRTGDGDQACFYLQRKR